MPLYARHRGSSSKGHDQWSWLFALLSLGLLLLLGWIGWHFTDFGKEKPAGPAAPTNAPSRPHVTAVNPPIAKPRPLPATSDVPIRVVTPSPPTQTVVAVPPVVPTNIFVPTPVPEPSNVGAGARPVQNTFEAQLAMAREGISPGSIDGGLGSQTRAALSAYQRKHGLVPTGVLDGDTKALLSVSLPLYTTYTVTSDDLARLLPLPRTWLGKSEQPRLDYETTLELVAEKAFSHPKLIQMLNPDLTWSNVLAGTVVKIPRVSYPPAAAKAELIKISLSAKNLEAFDSASNLLVHFPCSIGKLAEKRPVGELRVAVKAPNPNYTFNPSVFPESEEGRQLGRKLIIPPGPNNPVGVAWIGLDRPGYGIHGTPAPEQVGRTESHGCFRLANWNAEYLLKLVNVGTPVVVEP